MSMSKKEEILLSFSASKDEKKRLEHIASLLWQTAYHRPKVCWNSNAYKIQTHVSKVFNLFREAGFPIGQKILTVMFPNLVMQSNTIVQKAFLQGYFDADGCTRFESQGENT